MYTPTQIEAIKIFGRKDLTEGCIIRHFYSLTYGFFLGYSSDKSSFDCNISYDGGNTIDSPDISDIRKCILGHIPTLEDVFRVAEEKDIKIGIGYGFGGAYITYYNGDGIFPYNPTIPVLEQDEKSLKELISLFK